MAKLGLKGIALLALVLLLPLLASYAVDALSNNTRLEEVWHADSLASAIVYYNGSSHSATWSYDDVHEVLVVIIPSYSGFTDDYMLLSFGKNATWISDNNINRIIAKLSFDVNFTNAEAKIYLDDGTNTVDLASKTFNGSEVTLEAEISFSQALTYKVNYPSAVVKIKVTPGSSDDFSGSVIVDVSFAKASVLFTYEEARTWTLFGVGILGWLMAVFATKSISLKQLAASRRRR